MSDDLRAVEQILYYLQAQPRTTDLTTRGLQIAAGIADFDQALRAAERLRDAGFLHMWSSGETRLWSPAGLIATPVASR